jgi:MerR HTH family regulatory protein
MQNENLVEARQFCISHNLEISFLSELQEHGLVEITTVEQESYLTIEQLPEVEKVVRLHSDLGINMEGIDAIRHLLQRMENIQQELIQLRSRLGIYED